jgi:hypothetical protein
MATTMDNDKFLRLLKINNSFLQITCIDHFHKVSSVLAPCRFFELLEHRRPTHQRKRH